MEQEKVLTLRFENGQYFVGWELPSSEKPDAEAKFTLDELKALYEFIRIALEMAEGKGPDYEKTMVPIADIRKR